MNPENLKSGDTDELEALFDSIADQRAWDAPVAAPAQVQQEAPVELSAQCEEPHDVFHRVGSLTRKLHDALRELGYDKSVETAVNSLPDARARLNYIASLTGQAAEKVLATVEVSQKLNDTVADEARALDKQWDRLHNNELSLEEFKELARQNREFVQKMAGHTSEMGGHLTSIMMAQDFHDLTGQVVNRIANMAQGLEEQLVQLLLDTTPPDQRKQVEETWLNGPTINAEGRSDVCANQTQVDDLLESLGF